MADFKYQIASLLVMTIIIVDYLRRKKLPLKVNRLFFVFLILSFSTILFEIFSVFTINHIETVPKFINRRAHQLFIGSLDLSIFLLFMYITILTKGSDHKEKPINILLRFVPIVISLLMVVFGPLNYYIGNEGRYSYGLMAYTVYGSVSIYTALIIIELFKSGKVNKTTKFQITSGVSMWAIIAIIQAIFPVILISSVALVMMVLFVYLSFEHPGEYIDPNTKILNTNAFEIVSKEMFVKENEFYVNIISLNNPKLLIDSFGHTCVEDLVDDLILNIKDETNLDLYRFNISSIALISLNEKRLEDFTEIIKNIKWNYNNFIFSDLFNIFEIVCPNNSSNIDELYDLIHYITSRGMEIDFNQDNKTIINKYNEYKKIEKVLENAFNNHGFEMYYQPIYNTKLKRFTNCEALIRLNDNSLGYISPEIFIPLIEEKGWIHLLDKMVFELVCKDISELNFKELGLEHVEINLSRKQADEKNLVLMIKDIVEKYNIDPKMLNLEITETSATELNQIMIGNISKLKKFGITFSMDDFGTGYSNLSQIAKLKFDIIKIDKSLIWPCFDKKNKESLIVLNNCIKMILELDVKIVAEGIENEEQANFLIDLGVDYLQGYLYSKPIEKNKFVEFMRSKNNME